MVGRHCKSCGNEVGVDCGEWEGYTSCCNKSTCDCDDNSKHKDGLIITED